MSSHTVHQLTQKTSITVCAVFHLVCAKTLELDYFDKCSLNWTLNACLNALCDGENGLRPGVFIYDVQVSVAQILRFSQTVDWCLFAQCFLGLVLLKILYKS